MIVMIGDVHKAQYLSISNMKLPALPLDTKWRLWVTRDLADWVTDASMSTPIQSYIARLARLGS